MKRKTGGHERREHREVGQSLVEFAFVLPVILILLAGILDLGRLYFAYVAVTDAAAEGARYGSLYPLDTIGITQRAAQATGGYVQLVDAQNQIQVDYPIDGSFITVTVVYSHSLATPFVSAMFEGGVLVLRAQSVNLVMP